MKKNLIIPVVAVFAMLFFAACVKDVDFSKADAISLTPVEELDLIHFTVQASDFFDANTSNPILTLRDTTEIRFLNDSGFQESLKRAEFYFKFTNSIPRDFEVEFDFLSEENESTYTTRTTVSQGTIVAPIITEFTQNVEGDDVAKLTQAEKVVVSVNIPSSNANLEGTLNLQSKATYYLEY